MKNVSVLKVSLWLTTLAGIYGCQEQNLWRLPKPPTNDTVKVQIAFTPEISFETPSPLTQKQTADIIAVQVYAHENQTKSAYARGLFSSTSQIPALDLQSSRQYSIETTIITDGQNLVAKRSTDGAFYRPFSVTITPQPITNEFKYIATPMNYLSSGAGDILSKEGLKKTYNHPLWQRYAGYSGKFFARDSTSIRIVARRTYSAIKLNISGLSAGKMKIEFDDAPIIEFSNTDNYQDSTIFIALTGTIPTSESWVADGYSEQINCIVTHINQNGQQTPITPSTGTPVTLKRNHIHPLIIRMDQSGKPMISLEDSPMIKGPDIIL